MASTDLETDETGHYLLVLGRDTVFVLNISVNNFGEPAYEAMLYVSHPKSMSYIGWADDVSYTSYVIIKLIGLTLSRQICN